MSTSSETILAGTKDEAGASFISLKSSTTHEAPEKGLWGISDAYTMNQRPKKEGSSKLGIALIGLLAPCC